MNWPTPEAQLANAQLAIVAHAEWTRPERGSPMGESVTRFTVIRTLKGERRTAWQIAHFNGPGGAACDIEFKPGERVLVFASPNRGRLRTSMCQRPLFPLAAYDRAVARR